MTEKTCDTCKHYTSDFVAPCLGCSDELSKWEPATPAPTGEPVAYTEAEMYRMQEAGTLPKPQAWLVYCKGEPHVQPNLYRHFTWSQFHTPVWMPLVFDRAAAPPPTAALEAEVERLRAELSYRIEATQSEAAEWRAERAGMTALLRQAREALETYMDDYYNRVDGMHLPKVYAHSFRAALAHIDALKEPRHD
ncbi:MAG: hypothetical protein KGJ38_08245 [Burkholderiaceae bacterium]|nr:hypothetical protein [Burkholderiaceae bacterium]